MVIILRIRGDYNFNTIAQTLAEWIPPATLLDALHETAVQLIDLPERLAARGVPEQIMEMPAMGFATSRINFPVGVYYENT